MGATNNRVATANGSSDDDELPAWAERCLTRADELEALTDWALACVPAPAGNGADPRAQLKIEIHKHLTRAKKAATTTGSRLRREGARLDTAMSRLDAAEAELLNLVPAVYLAGQLPSILNHVARHLQPMDPRRLEVERIAADVKAPPGPTPTPTSSGLGVLRLNRPLPGDRDTDAVRRAARIVDNGRISLVTAMRGASSAALREQTRVRSFRNAVLAATGGMLLVAGGLVLLGALNPAAVPLCFAPAEGEDVTIVCPTEQSGPIDPASEEDGATATDINAEINDTVGRIDLATVAIVGSTAAAVAAAAAIRRIRGSSEPYGVPIALAVLKLPTGAVTAILGLLLMRGGFIPGLSALDSSAQIIAWAAIFGYAQQLFTRLVDQQANAVLDNVRGGDKGTQAPHSE